MSPTRPNQMTIGCTGGADMTPHGCAGALSYAGRGRPGKGSWPTMRALSWFLGLMAVALAPSPRSAGRRGCCCIRISTSRFIASASASACWRCCWRFVAVARHLGLADRASLGYGVPRREFVREMALGLILGVVSMLALVGLMSALGLLDWTPAAAFSVARAGQADRAARCERFRGGVHRGDLPARRHAQRDRARVGYHARRCCCTALLYAATHFFASFHIPPEQVSAHSGLTLLAGTLHRFAHPAAIADAFLALFAVGVVLGAGARDDRQHRRLHRAARRLGVGDAHDARADAAAAGRAAGFLLSRFDGFVGWLVLAWTVLLTVPLWRFYSRRARRGAPVSTAQARTASRARLS